MVWCKVEGDKVVGINLSDNNLSGQIPEIAELVNLQELNLHKNNEVFIPTSRA
jgi:hypothetical protein